MILYTLLSATVGLILFFSSPSGAAEAKTTTRTTSRPTVSGVAPEQVKTLATRRILVERMKASRERLQNTLPAYEAELERHSADYEAKKSLFEKNLISAAEVEDSEQALTNKRLEMERVREWIAEDNRALSLAEDAAQEKFARLPNLPLGGYEETATLIHFNGPAKWSLAGVKKIAQFYRQSFGRSLPLSAMGQSPTHDTMGLDHREALDVAVQPDSVEGRGLMSYLRKNGIPFIAFRSAVAHMSTGAHIHVGRPSPRIVEAKQRQRQPNPPDKSVQDRQFHSRSSG